MSHPTVYIGYDPREDTAWQVARNSLLRKALFPPVVRRLDLDLLQQTGLYVRPTLMKPGGGYIDRLSQREDYDGSMSTAHAIARFFIPLLTNSGWALFVDGDVLFRSDITMIFETLNPRKALYCVQHDYQPVEKTKMDGQVQSRYHRKNWSSFMIFNCGHPANRNLTRTYLNSTPGRDLHAFSWLKDDDIGSLSPELNYLVGHYTVHDVPNPKVVHFTEGLPYMPGYADCEFSAEWRYERSKLTENSKPPPLTKKRVDAAGITVTWYE